MSFLEKPNFRKNKYSFFDKDQSIPFYLICDVFDTISTIKGKDSVEKKKKLLTKMFELVLVTNPREIMSVYYYCCLKLDAEWLQKDLGVGTEILMRVIHTITSRPLKILRTDFKKVGDHGLLFEKSKKGQGQIGSFFGQSKQDNTNKRVTFEHVFDAFKQMAQVSGTKSQKQKEEIFVNLLRLVKGNEGKYMCRFITGNFIIGSAEKNFQSAISRAFCHYFEDNKYKVTEDEIREDNPNSDILLPYSDYKLLEKTEKYSMWDKALQRMITQYPYHGDIFSTLLSTKSLQKTLDKCKLTVNIPCKPMLAKPTKSFTQIFSRLEDYTFTCEYKYDGLRGQIHFRRDQNDIQIFSRNLENMSEMYPDIAQAIKTFTKQNTDKEELMVNSFIIDTEIVAIDKRTNRILPFQILATRSKKNVSLSNQEVAVCIYIFDLLYFNGKSYLTETYKKRRDTLKEMVAHNYDSNMILLAESKDCDNVEEIQEFLDESIKAGCEGLMVKTLEKNSTYEPSKRSYKWLKVKKDYLENGGIGDSLDLVVLGAIHGKGKRKGVYGGFLVGSYNSDLEEYEACCVVGTGLSDEVLQSSFNELNKYIVDEVPDQYVTGKADDIDVWFLPRVVWEIKVADIQISPKYKCAGNEMTDTVNEGKGLGMRFPRYLRLRDDKHATDATDSKFIYELYSQQATVNNNERFDDEDYY